jgi:hypothetical protein
MPWRPMYPAVFVALIRRVRRFHTGAQTQLGSGTISKRLFA